MYEDDYNKMYKNEEYNWRFKSKVDIVRELGYKFKGNYLSNFKIFDAGCGKEEIKT